MRPKGFKHTRETKEKMSLKATGEKNHFYKTGITMQEWICIDCKKPCSVYTKRCKKCSSKINIRKCLKKRKLLRGRDNPMFGKPAPHGKGQYYKGIWMRSSYEIAYAKWLDRHKIQWDYESQTFDLGDTTYTPDFYLPKAGKFVEVKGYWRKGAKLKFSLFKKIYKHIKITIITLKDLKNIGGVI